MSPLMVFASAGASQSSRTFTDAKHGIEVTYPAGWKLEKLAEVEEGGGVRLKIISGRRSLPAEPCNEPINGAFGKKISLHLAEYGEGSATSYPDRPQRFADAASFTSTPPPDGVCAHGEVTTLRSISFSDSGRFFTVLMAVGSTATQKRLAEAYKILDSLRIDPLP